MRKGAAGIVAVGVAAAGVLTWQGLAAADGDGAVHACAGETHGQLRVVAEGEACKNGERALTWSETGPAGPAGPQGDKGDKGDKGDAGTSAPAAPAPIGTLTITTTSPASTIGPLPVTAYAFGASADSSWTRGSGASIGKPAFQDLAVTRSVDEASTALLRTLATGRILPSVVLTLCDPAACAATTTATYELGDSLVTSVQQGAAPLTEAVTLAFKSVTFTRGAQLFAYDVTTAVAA